MELELNSERLEALSSSFRREIVDELDERPDYPASLADRLDVSRQKLHYHLEKLKDSGLVMREDGVYRPAFDRLVFPGETRDPALDSIGSRGFIVSGSPDQHGERQVRGRDGHLTGFIAGKLARHGKQFEPVLDTELEAFQGSLVLIGGPTTNLASRDLNEEFDPGFDSGFPPKKVTWNGEAFSSPGTGVVSFSGEKVLVAGLRRRGTVAAARAFREEDLQGSIVVEARDRSGNGRVDGYEVVER